ncbi:MAG: replication-associated recombination protein A, partial [Verrucomicrobiae bacterium]|nr:replication-associated recombination protein A [Verrucomicrobiae bacterium]
RSQIFRFEPLNEDSIIRILQNALQHPQRGFNNLEICIEPEALRFLARYGEGDARRSLNALELAILTASSEENKVVINLDLVKECVSEKLLHYDKTGDEHYD